MVGENWMMKDFFQQTSSILGITIPQKVVSESLLWWLQKLDSMREFLLVRKR